MVEKVKNKESSKDKKEQGKSKSGGRKEVNKNKNKGEMLAVIRVRGTVKVRGSIEETLKRLKLTKPNHCVVVPKNETYLGMIKKAKDYITWGEIDEEGIKLLDSKASKEGSNLYRLHPPVGGYESKGIKRTYSKGGAIGYRGKNIIKLIERMIKGGEKVKVKA